MAPSGSIGSLDPPGAETNVPHRPAPIVLDLHARVGAPMNKDTVAAAKSRAGHIMEVSFLIHQPPDLSYFCVKWHKVPNSKYKDDDFEEEPHVVSAEGRFVVLCARFTFGEDEYFMYKAGDSVSGETASLYLVPPPREFRLPRLSELGIVPRCHGHHYLLAALCLDPSPCYYLLNIFSSQDEKWRRIQVPNPFPEMDRVIGSKVVTIGEGSLGWVDFQHGMLVCNLHEERPSTRYIPLPDPLPKNKCKIESSPPGQSARRYRDLTCKNGIIKFIEVEHDYYFAAVTNEYDEDVERVRICNSDLIMSRKRKYLRDKPKMKQFWGGWKAVVWMQAVSSGVWERGHVLDVKDITCDKALFSSFLCGLGEDVKELTFKDMYSAFPTLSSDGDDDILYLKTMVRFNSDGRLTVLDLLKKRMKGYGTYSLLKHEPSIKAFGPCLPPIILGTKDSNCGNFKYAGIPTNEPNNATEYCPCCSYREYSQQFPAPSSGTNLDFSNRQQQGLQLARVPQQPVLELWKQPLLMHQPMRRPLKFPNFRRF